MPLNFTMSLMSVVEFAALGRSRLPVLEEGFAAAVSRNECISRSSRGLDASPSWAPLHSGSAVGSSDIFRYYFYPYWAVYIASAITLFFVTLEIFRSVLSAFSGLMRLGTVVFRWVALVSAVASLGTVSFSHLSVMIIPDIAFALMRSVSILELCLLAFLCLCMNALQLSLRDIAFGFGLGFGLMSANDFIIAAIGPGDGSLTAPLQFAYQGVILVTLWHLDRVLRHAGAGSQADCDAGQFDDLSLE